MTIQAAFEPTVVAERPAEQPLSDLAEDSVHSGAAAPGRSARDSVEHAAGRSRDARVGRRDNPVIWVLVVGAILLAVPMMSEWINTPRSAVAPRTSSTAPAADTTPPVAVPPVTPATPPAPSAQPVPAPAQEPGVLQMPAPPPRQFVTKCIEHGRVVYTQSDTCATGQMSAVPVQPDKNVVGPGETQRPRKP